ncbi:MAG: hypothetical protein QME71_05045 [Dehalococcoidia bacterium]|nr:hypothetical protein [Dehalococcoidia bacterium]
MTMRDKFRRRDRPERRLNMLKGAVLAVLFVLVAAIVLDLAVFFAKVRKAQWVADGVAMAAAAELSKGGSETSALNAVTDWLHRNEVAPLKGECCVFEDKRPFTAPDGAPDTVTAMARATHSTVFLSLFGLPEEISVERTATAHVVGSAGGALCPLAVLGDPTDLNPDDGTYLGLGAGRVYAIDLADAPRQPGDFLPLDFDGTGIDGFYERIAGGCKASAQSVRSEGDVTTPLASDGDASRLALRGLSEHYANELGDGVADYLNFAWCDIDFAMDGAGPGIGHATGFDPNIQLPRKECVRGTADGGMGRIVLVPVVSAAGGESGLTVLGVAAMYVVGWDRGSADDGMAYGMFLERALAGDELTGEDDINPLAPLRVVLAD